jgi:polyhydroxybutyrate depolymerase
MKRMLLALPAVLVTVCAVACGNTASGSQRRAESQARARANASAQPGLQSLTINAGGLVRSYLLYVPPGDSSKHRLPLVLVFHGAGDTAQNTTGESGLLSFDEKHGSMILAFLQGVQQTWNDDTGDPAAEAENVDDIGFTKAVLNKLESSYAVNMKRVVVTGLSNGAIMVELLGCRIGGNVTLVVPVEGQMGTRFSGSCRPSRPVSVYEVHATADPNIPYAGGTFSGSGGPATVLSAKASAQRWATVDHCAKSASVSRAGGSILTHYRRCGSGVTVTLNTILGGKHQWPPGFASTLAGAINGLSNRRQAVMPQ